VYEAPIPVTIVTGFLGAGKSTLVQRWLQELPRGETAVIVNERGEVGIDGELLSAHVSRLREITGGCVCCSSQAELMSALLELAESSPRPGRILVETSGAASPAGVVRAMAAPRAREQLQLDGVITVVDVTRVRQTVAFDLAIEQLGFADVVVLSHADAPASSPLPLDVPRAQEELLRYAPTAIFASAHDGVVGSSMLELLAQRAQTLHVPTESSTHTVIKAVSLLLDGELDEERFGEWVEHALGDVEARILRLKGILAMEGVAERVVLQGIGENIDVRLGPPWQDARRTSRLVVLGLDLDATTLEAGFFRCAAGRPSPSGE
jgi:G3E family GTPase